MHLLPERQGAAALHAVARAAYDGIYAVGSILRPCQTALAVGGWVEQIAAHGDGAGTVRAEVEITYSRLDLLGEHPAASVFRPPNPSRGAVVNGARRHLARVAQRALLARGGVEQHEARRVVEILLQKQQRIARHVYGIGIFSIAPPPRRGEERGRVLRGGQRGPVVGQRTERAAEQIARGEAEELAHGESRRDHHPRMARSVGRYLVAYHPSRRLVAVRHELVAELIVVGDEVAVGAAEEFVGVAVFGGYVAHSAEFEREARLFAAAERRRLRLGHGGVALDHPQRHVEQADGGALLPEQAAEELHESHVEVVVLHGVTVFVRHQLLDPRHRVAVDGGSRKKLHALGQPHHQTVRAHVLGVHDERNVERGQAVAVRYVRLHYLDKTQGRESYLGRMVGIDHIGALGFGAHPSETRGVGAPAVILRAGAFGRDEGRKQYDRKYDASNSAHDGTGDQPPAFLHPYPAAESNSATRSRRSP